MMPGQPQNRYPTSTVSLSRLIPGEICARAQVRINSSSFSQPRSIQTWWIRKKVEVPPPNDWIPRISQVVKICQGVGRVRDGVFCSAGSLGKNMDLLYQGEGNIL
jgi:hypothetical protein